MLSPGWSVIDLEVRRIHREEARRAGYREVQVRLHESSQTFMQLNESCRYLGLRWRQLQEGYIFSDSIAGNIVVSDEHPDMDRARSAARISNIDEWMESLPLGYNTKIGAEGQGLSTGQKQRALIARTACKNARPTTVVFTTTARIWNEKHFGKRSAVSSVESRDW